MHNEILLNSDWLFHKGDIAVPLPSDKGPVYSQSKTERKLIGPAAYHYFDLPDQYRPQVESKSIGWKWVNLPHDYIVTQDLNEHGNNALGYLDYENAWYRKHFDLPEEYRGKRVTLRFEGVTGKSTVYLNGCLMKHNFSSYNSFEIDISKIVYFDKENVLAVYVNVEKFEGWWYHGGGIYRDVILTVTDPVAIDLYGVYAPYKKLNDREWQINFETTVVNDTYQDATVTLESTVIGADGKEIGKATANGTVALFEKGTLKYSTVVCDPLLWDTENPNLYTVKTVLKTADGMSDENSIRIGFRTIEINPKDGFLLNGKKTVIKGVCCHQDFGLTGLAVPDNIAKYKIGMMKEMGANGFRTSHYQNSTVNMDTFDELGFLVMDETRWFEASEEAIEQLTTLVKRDRNRPSVIFWSTGNEEYCHITEIGGRIHKALYHVIKKLDDTRFITAAQSDNPEESTIYADCDVIGINYHLENYDHIHEQYPDKIIFSSENCATGTTRDWILPANEEGRIRDKDGDTNKWFRGRELTWKFLMERPFVIGGYQWAAVEHRGEASWPTICSKSGAIDLFLQRKGGFYLNQALWTDEPMVHIAPHWNQKGLEGEEVPVTVYTNCDELELFLNGKSLGRKAIEKYGHGEWAVVYEPGELCVKAYRDGKQVAEDCRKTTKKPEKLRLRLENSFKANGQDLALFTCECLDEDGLAVPDAAEFVHFSTTKEARIIGTGSDNCDHTNVNLPDRKMYMGKISVAVKPIAGSKRLELYAQSANCGIAKIVVDIEE